MNSKLEETWDRQPNESWDQYIVRKMQEEKQENHPHQPEYVAPVVQTELENN